MKKVLFLVFMALSITVSAQEFNKHVMDETRQKEILVNSCTREGLTSFPEFKTSYDANYVNYKADSLAINSLKSTIQDYNLTVVLGTWCGDSKLHVPNLFKILDLADFKSENVHIIAVNGLKKVENESLEGLNITRVPTIIVRNKEGVEVGRITERPTVNIESDLLAIITPKN